MNQLEPVQLVLKPGAELEFGQGNHRFRRSVLPGGVRVFTQEDPGQQSVAVGAWFGVGSRDETPGGFGSTHFLEHLLFKGTATRSAFDIAASFDAIGGESNALTAKEYTSYYARVRKQDLGVAMEIIMDMVTAAALRQEDFDVERQVIIDELAMSNDDPHEVINDAFLGKVLVDHPLGRPVGGTIATVTDIPLSAVKAHYERCYEPSHLVIAAAGAVGHEQLCALVLDLIDKSSWKLEENTSPTGLHEVSNISDLTAGCHHVARPIEQSHVIMGTRGMAANDERKPVMSVLLSILGGGMSSRLFQEVREKRGLAYSTYAFDAAYREAGAFGLYAGCSPDNLEQTQRVMQQEWEKIASAPVELAELNRAKGQLAGGITLGLEDNSARMGRLGRAEVSLGRYLTAQTMIANIQAVTIEQIQELAAELFAMPQVTVTVGPA